MSEASCEIDFQQGGCRVPHDAQRVVQACFDVGGSGVGLNCSGQFVGRVVLERAVTKDGNVVPGIVKLVDRARHGGAIVGKGVHFDGEGIVGKHPTRTVEAVSDLGAVDGQGACGEVGNLLKNKAHAVRPIVTSAKIHLEVQLKGRTQMQGAFMPGRTSSVVDVGGELNTIRATREGIPNKTPLSPRRKRSTKNQETGGDEETHQWVRGCG